MNIADPTFGLTAQSLTVLHALAGWDLDNIIGRLPDEEKRHWETHTYPMYNGRERGICITFGKWISTNCRILHIFFSECRNSDNIVVTWWFADRPFNAPELNTDDETWTKNHAFFPWGRVDQVVQHIIGLMKNQVG